MYIISTPIGNLKDITLRALETLEKLDYLVCEDTRKTGLLLKNLNISSHPKLISLNAYNENRPQKLEQIITFLKAGNDVGLVSNAGTPLINDPGFKLVREAKGQGIKIIPIPGPSSIIAALISSGLPTDRFTYLGFLPKKESQLKKILMDIKTINDVGNISQTHICFVSPHNLVKSLQTIMNTFGDIEICIASELTKIYENVETKRVGEWIKFFEEEKPRGEYTLLFRI